MSEVRALKGSEPLRPDLNHTLPKYSLPSWQLEKPHTCQPNSVGGSANSKGHQLQASFSLSKKEQEHKVLEILKGGRGQILQALPLISPVSQSQRNGLPDPVSHLEANVTNTLGPKHQRRVPRINSLSTVYKQM